MSDDLSDLRTRIIRIISAEVYGDIGNSDLSLATRAADAVIRELDSHGLLIDPEAGDLVERWQTDQQKQLLTSAGEGIDLTDDEFNEFLSAAKGEELRITDQGAAVIESGLTVWQAHEVKYGCSRDKPCEKCRSYGTAYTYE